MKGFGLPATALARIRQSDPVTPADLAATIYWRFGIDPQTEIRDATARPFPLALGEADPRLYSE